jgi:hypothetical protein
MKKGRRHLIGLWVAWLLSFGLAHADRVPAPIHVGGGVVQITGKGLRVGQRRFRRSEPADPFVDVLPSGTVHLYGTGPRGRDGRHGYLEFESLADLLAGGKAHPRSLTLVPGLSGPGAQPWDLMVHRWPDGQEVLYGGVMLPTGRRSVHAQWPTDNWTRRIYAFRRDEQGRWVMHDQPLFNAITPGQAPTMIGHAYGHHFKTILRQTPSGPSEETWLFHEEVSRQIQTRKGPRLVTELFARKMIDPFTASPERVKLLGVGDPPRFGARENGDFLLEGPRPFETTLGGEAYHFITFSSADFANDRYDIHFAYRRGDGIGEYKPFLRRGADGRDELTPFAERLKLKHGLSWVGRAHVIRTPDGGLAAVFHGVRKLIRPGVDYSGKQPADLGAFHRAVFTAPLRITLGGDGEPTIELIDEPMPPQRRSRQAATSLEGPAVATMGAP